jgi:Uma2 family endonuclease
MQPPSVLAPDMPATPPDHLQLPDTDGSIVENFLESPQSNLLTECLTPRLDETRPDGQYCIGCDSGIYWRWTQPVLEGCKAPDWFVVLGVPPMLDGTYRRSYVLWREVVKPLLVIEYVSGDGNVERDTTPYKGKFWVYEQGISASFYAIYEVEKASVEVYRLETGRYHLIPANSKGRYPIDPLGIELGIWDGSYRKMKLPWLRAWDAKTGEMMMLAEERAETAEGLLVDTRQMLGEETERAEEERKRANEAARQLSEETRRADEEAQLKKEAEQKAERLAARLRELGIPPEEV